MKPARLYTFAVLLIAGTRIHCQSNGLPPEIKLQIITWNVNKSHPPPQKTLQELVDFASEPDIIVIGLQEVPAFLHQTRRFWQWSVVKAVEKKGYTLVKRKTLLGIVNMVFIADRYKKLARSYRRQIIPTGPYNFGNKGAVSIKISLGNVNMRFVVAHLPAHDNMEKERIETINRIYNKISRSHSLYPVRFSFLLGDLNFRLTNAPEEFIEEKMSSPNSNDYLELLQYDEFLAEGATKEMLQGMEEQPIKFPPTFKFIVGTSNYSHKRRVAWTDRVLYRETTSPIIGRHESVKNISYERLEAFKNSDHKPVRAIFEIIM